VSHVIPMTPRHHGRSGRVKAAPRANETGPRWTAAEAAAEEGARRADILAGAVEGMRRRHGHDDEVAAELSWISDELGALHALLDNGAHEGRVR
jgi:hypothetical protein